MTLQMVKPSLKQQYYNILKNQDITTFFQPILSLKNCDILGYEALSRGPVDSCFYYPDQLFNYAKKINKIWELDLLCRVKSIERAKEIIGDKLLFINIDPDIIKDKEFKQGFTKEFLENNNVRSDNVIFEITEHTAVKDYKGFNRVLENYRQQGYRIALDDVGEGYSGLRLMTEVRPNFIKIDMSLVHNIHKDKIRKELLKCFQQFSKVVDIHIIAEGVETYEELKTLIEIGIPYGQGYYLQHPSQEFTPISPSLVKEIKEINKQN